MKRQRIRPSLPYLLAALAPSLSPSAAAQSAVSVYVPGYRSGSWDDLVGSVVMSDSTATTYTVFCEDSESCRVTGPFPFTFAEGPSTFRYSGSISDRLTAVMSCALAGTTAATCTEYSSFGEGFTGGSITGPTETTRTATYTGSDVQWGVLTLTTRAPGPTASTETGGGHLSETTSPTDTAWFFPSPTGNATVTAAAGGRLDATVSAALLSGGLAMLGAALI